LEVIKRLDKKQKQILDALNVKTQLKLCGFYCIFIIMQNLGLMWKFWHKTIREN
jgi:hypothetical protein